MLTADFDYHLPAEAIAQVPVEPRHAARLLDTRTMTDRFFIDLPELLRPGDVVVVNRTRVRAARLKGHKKESGGAVELLLLRKLDQQGGARGASHALRFEALVRPARRLKAGAVIEIEDLQAVLLTDPKEGVAEIQLTADGHDVEAAVAAAGEVPLPPYIRTQLHDPERYQTIFARAVGSAAAPTAGLHFSAQVVERMHDRDIELVEVELEVGLDTFRPIGAERVEDHRIHRERYRLPIATARAVGGARHRGGRVVAIGTTVVRVLESQGQRDGTVAAGEGETSLFIRPGNDLHVVDAMVTNFHAPRTTLLLLVAAFLEDRWREVYETALARGYRFLSFGDAMYMER